MNSVSHCTVCGLLELEDVAGAGAGAGEGEGKGEREGDGEREREQEPLVRTVSLEGV